MAQQLWAPVHCVLHEHEVGDGGLAQSGAEAISVHVHHGHSHGHSHGDHGHGTAGIESQQETPDHKPHPIEDDLARVVEKLAPKVSSGEKLTHCVCHGAAAAPVPSNILRVVGMAWYGVHSAHGPPELRGSAPRGPPVIV